MFGSLISLVENTARLVVAPIALAVDVADAIVEPIANVVEELADDVRDVLK